MPLWQTIKILVPSLCFYNLVFVFISSLSRKCFRSFFVIISISYWFVKIMILVWEWYTVFVMFPYIPESVIISFLFDFWFQKYCKIFIMCQWNLFFMKVFTALRKIIFFYASMTFNLYIYYTVSVKTHACFINKTSNINVMKITSN